MVQSKQIRVALTTVLIAACLVTTSQAQQSTSSDRVRGRAYLFYGLIAAIDWGMDELAERINRSGVAASTNAHSSWRSVAIKRSPTTAVIPSRSRPSVTP